MLFVIRIYKVLNFCHSKFSNSQKSLLRMDFISEAKTNLSSSEWHTAIIIVKKTPEVDEYTLSSLGA